VQGPDVTVVVPTLGGSSLDECLAAVAALDPAPLRVVVVASGAAAAGVTAGGVEVVRSWRRLGFAAAVNRGLEEAAGADLVALLNDDALPAPPWLGVLRAGLCADPGLGAVQGTVTDAAGDGVDGRGIAFDRFGLPVQVDRGSPAAPEPERTRPVLAVSGTAALLRTTALHQVALPGRTALDPCFGSYHEDLDLGLRLRRAGWTSAWVPGAPCRHLGSATGSGFPWRHPWWVLANRWRALGGNLTLAALAAVLPRLARGELRAVRTLARANPRALLVAPAVALAAPFLVLAGRLRASTGPRLGALPGDRP
jgi:GT2 family glycosyltransferase